MSEMFLRRWQVAQQRALVEMGKRARSFRGANTTEVSALGQELVPQNSRTCHAVASADGNVTVTRTAADAQVPDSSPSRCNLRTTLFGATALQRAWRRSTASHEPAVVLPSAEKARQRRGPEQVGMESDHR
jgi:hypothetical protein